MDLDNLFPAADGTTPLARIFGVRHLSPAGAIHLRAVLDELKPTAVLVEGPADATEQLIHLAHKDTRPPVAVLAYTQERPVRSILYPMAAYSPEWIALTWGLKNKATVRFIDLPAEVFLQLHEVEHKEGDEEPKPPPSPDEPRPVSDHTRAYMGDPFEDIARLAGEPDHETWWERHFEHTVEPATYIQQIFHFGHQLRQLRTMDPTDENLIREAYMRREIQTVLGLKGHKPEKVLVVCGAFHASALVKELPAMTDKEVAKLPRAKCSLTLMPYSFVRLSSQSGYGAGNHAPGYFHRLFHSRDTNKPETLVPAFLSEICREIRSQGQVRSAADVIEAVRLAMTLAALNDSPAPVLRDLRDAALTCLGRGEREVIAKALQEIEIGTAIGRLPKGILRTSIQDDFYRLTEDLKLEKYLSEKKMELELDLREDRYAKTPEGAFRDRNRSTFLHRLGVLGIAFGDKEKSRQEAATWKEIWNLKWSPDCEIQLVENALIGETVEMATAIKLSQKLANTDRIDKAAQVVKEAVLCELADALENARRRLQAMAVEETGFIELSRAVAELAEVISYGNVRKFDPKPLEPLLSQLFLRATLALKDACRCDDAGAREHIRPAIVRLHDVAETGALAEIVDADRWQNELDKVALTDSLNAYLSGFVLSLILPRIPEETLSLELQRRLSVGVPPDIAGNWVEGLMQYNREVLFNREAVWRTLDAYVVALDDPGFRKALVPLRRALGQFEPAEVRRICGLLVSISEVGGKEIREITNRKLDDKEAEQLQDQLGGLEF
jgi:hypothetical protein